VTSRDFSARLIRRARRAHVELSPGLIPPLEEYFRLLGRWNAKINLTALPLQPTTDEAFDRLFIEPLRATSLIPDGSRRWFDLGSGGGSPAIPMKLARPHLTLVLVESKARKAAFLRETIRALKLPEAEVANCRFEELAAPTQEADLVTVRAVRPDSVLLGTAARLIRAGGRLLLFGGPARLNTFDFTTETSALPGESGSNAVAVYQRTFHVEQKR
jgi:16S rRNA (guanine527-N7)-methyltransferase